MLPEGGEEIVETAPGRIRYGAAFSGPPDGFPVRRETLDGECAHGARAD